MPPDLVEQLKSEAEANGNPVVFIWDIDNVLAYTNELTLDKINDWYGTCYSYDRGDMTSYHYEGWMPSEHAATTAVMYEQESFYDDLYDDPRAVSCVKALMGDGWPVVFATNRAPSLRSITEDWLDDLGLDAPLVIGPGGKSKLVLDLSRQPYKDTQMGLCGLLVDDNHYEALGALERRGCAMIPRKTYTPAGLSAEGLWVFDDWSVPLILAGELRSFHD